MTIEQSAPSTRGNKMMTHWLRLAAVIGLALGAACTLDNADPPALGGPSELGTSIELRAIPDELVSDGFSSSVIEAVVRDSSGQRSPGHRVEFDITTPGAPNTTGAGAGFLDLGNLSPLNGARPAAGGVASGPVSATTDADGVARARYWAPFRTDQANDTTVEITGREISTNFSNQTLRRVTIFLRAADRPSFPGSAACSFIIEPAAGIYEIGDQIFFTATQSTGSSGHPIARYEWDFGDGSGHEEGRSVSRVYTTPGTFTVTLFTTESITGNQTFCTNDVVVADPLAGGGGGGGGGGAGGGNCGTLLVESTDVPHTTSTTGANLDGPSITVRNRPDCLISGIEVEFYATATDMSVSFPGQGVVRFDRIGGPIGFDLINVNAQIGAPLTGTNVGSGCGSLSFSEGGADFSTSSAPYDGSFTPHGRIGSFNTFNDYFGRPANGDYHLYAAFLGDSIIFECFRITFTLMERP